MYISSLQFIINTVLKYDATHTTHYTTEINKRRHRQSATWYVVRQSYVLSPSLRQKGAQTLKFIDRRREKQGSPFPTLPLSPPVPFLSGRSTGSGFDLAWYISYLLSASVSSVFTMRHILKVFHSPLHPLTRLTRGVWESVVSSPSWPEAQPLATQRFWSILYRLQICGL